MELNTVSIKIYLTSFEFRSPETIMHETLIASVVNNYVDGNNFPESSKANYQKGDLSLKH